LAPIEPRLDAEDEGERLDIVLEVLEQEAPFAPFLQVEQVPALEIAGQNVPGLLQLRQPVVIVERLVACLPEVQPGGLVLDDKRAGPEQVDEAALVAGQIADALLVGRDLPPADPEAVEEVIVKGLGFALLVMVVPVLLPRRRRRGLVFRTIGGALSTAKACGPTQAMAKP
jgi:hypothetical protein